jgi:preprotein translocase subunit YajC
LPLIVIGALLALMYFLLIRPQRKRQVEQQRLLASVEPGDEILTVGGLYGIVHEFDEDEDLIVEIAEGIRVRIARRAIAAVVKPEDEHDIVDGEAIEEGDDGDDPGKQDANNNEDSVTAADVEDPTPDDRR